MRKLYVQNEMFRNEWGPQKQGGPRQVPRLASLQSTTGMTVLDDETIEWLFNTCPKILCGLKELI